MVLASSLCFILVWLWAHNDCFANSRLQNIFYAQIARSLVANRSNLIHINTSRVGRRNYDKLRPTYRLSTLHEMTSWNLLRYIVFDSPDASFVNAKTEFEKRYKCVLIISISFFCTNAQEYRYIAYSILSTHPFLHIAPRLRCTDSQRILTPTLVRLISVKNTSTIIIDMNRYTKQIIKEKGEGIMLRKPGSAYELGRSHALFKYKVCPPASLYTVLIEHRNWRTTRL